ncbi:MAG: hypothetical protein Q8M06_07640 [Methanobacteriaceae archaeon]|nr:hypothetical protein [Methanobacteriaceae archaeon]MDZ4172103.1 hypothetical protein [Methanobacteriaceae archaeon]
MSKFILAAMVAILLFGSYLFISTQTGLVEPVGRLALVKLSNPDMFPNRPHPEVLAQYAEKRGSKCALVVHFAGDSNYRQFKQGNVTIIELAMVDPEGLRTDIDWGEVISTFVLGPDFSKYNYRADGIEFDNLDDALDYVEKLAKKKGQEGPIPMVNHGNVRTGEIFLNPGCGFPLYVQIVWKEYGRFAAYYYIVRGLIEPYFNNPYAFYEISHASSLQKLYNQGDLDYT